MASRPLLRCSHWWKFICMGWCHFICTHCNVDDNAATWNTLLVTGAAPAGQFEGFRLPNRGYILQKLFWSHSSFFFRQFYIQNNDSLWTAAFWNTANIKCNFQVNTLVHKVDSLSSGNKRIYKLHWTYYLKYYLYNRWIHNYWPQLKLMTICTRGKGTFKCPWTVRYVILIE